MRINTGRPMTYVDSAAILPRVEDLGERLRRLRKHLKVRQKHVTALGGYLSKLENGHETNPSLETLEKIAQGYGFDKLSSFISALELQDPRQLKSPLHGPQQSATKEATNTQENKEGGAHDRVVPSTQRREILLDVAYAIIKAADNPPRQQTPAARAGRPRLPKDNRGTR